MDTLCQQLTKYGINTVAIDLYDIFDFDTDESPGHSHDSGARDINEHVVMKPKQEIFTHVLAKFVEHNFNIAILASIDDKTGDLFKKNDDQIYTKLRKIGKTFHRKLSTSFVQLTTKAKFYIIPLVDVGNSIVENNDRRILSIFLGKIFNVSIHECVVFSSVRLSKLNNAIISNTAATLFVCKLVIYNFTNNNSYAWKYEPEEKTAEYLAIQAVSYCGLKCVFIDKSAMLIEQLNFAKCLKPDSIIVLTNRDEWRDGVLYRNIQYTIYIDTCCANNLVVVWIFVILTLADLFVEK